LIKHNFNIFNRRWMKKRVVEGLMEEDKLFPWFEENEEEVYYVYAVLRVMLPRREWVVFSRQTILQWDRLHLALKFKRKNENLTLDVKIHIRMLKIWWIQEKMEYKGLLCFAVLRGGVISLNL